MLQTTRRFLARSLPLALALGAAVLTGGCSSNDVELKSVPSIYAEAGPSTPAGATQTVTMPASKLQFNILKNAKLVPEGNFLAVGVYEAGEPGHRRLCFLAQVDDLGAKEVYHTMLRAKGKRLFLTFNDVVVGVHPISTPITDGNIMFFSEVPVAEGEDPAQKMFDLNLATNETILEIRKLREKHK